MKIDDAKHLTLRSHQTIRSNNSTVISSFGSRLSAGSVCSAKRQVSFKDVVVHQFEELQGAATRDDEEEEELTPEETFRRFLLLVETSPFFLEQKVEAKRIRDFGLVSSSKG